MLGGMDGSLWMPAGMDEYARQEHVDAHPDDPHAAAAAAWEDWAAQQEDPDPTTAPVIGSMSTGVQSVSYSGARTVKDQALERAAFHRARARVYSAPVGPEFDLWPEVLTPDDSGNEALWHWDEPT